MSRGPGRIERAIRALWDAHPDEAFTTVYLLDACYPDVEPLDRRHLIAVMRAAHKVLARDPDWECLPSPKDRRTLIFCNRASVPSMLMRYTLQWKSHERAVEETREILGQTEPVPYQRAWRDRAESSARAHLAIRDASDPAEAERLKAQHEAEGAKKLAQLSQTIRATLTGRPAYVLPTQHGAPSTTLIALADRVRTLLVQNDPDAVRAGLAEIAAALDTLQLPVP